MHIPRKVSASGEPNPFDGEGFDSQNLETGLDSPAVAPTPRLDQQPFTEARRSNGRPIIVETCMRCGGEGECTDNGFEILCAACAR